MPNIRELGPGGIPGVPNTLRASETGPNAERQLGSTLRSNAAEQGRVIGEGISRIGPILTNAQNQAAQNEISTGTASYATSVFNQSQAWDKSVAGADPADLSIGQKAIDSNNEYWDNWANNFHTQKGQEWAATKAAEAKLSFQKSVIADNSTRAGYAAQANLKTYTDATVAHAGSNPEQLDAILAKVPEEINGTIPAGADAKVRAKAISDGVQSVQSAVAREALSKIATKDPNFQTDWAAGKYAKYDQYLSPSEQDALPKAAQAAQVAKQRAANADATAKEKAQRDAIEGAKAQTYASLRNPDGTPNYDAISKAHIAVAPGGSLSGLPGFKGSDYTEAQAAINSVESGSKAAKDDPVVKEDLQNRMASGDNPISEADIYKAEVNGHITPTTRAALVGEYNVLHPKGGTASPLANPVVKQEFDAGLARLDPSKNQDGYYIGPNGQELQNDELTKNQGITQAYKDWYLSTFMLGLEAGKKPEQLVDPNSPDAIWKHWTGPDPYGKINSPVIPPYNYGSKSPSAAPSAQPPKPNAPAPAARPSLDSLWGVK